MQVQTIAEQLLFTTVRVETKTTKGIGTGTAFIFNYAVVDKSYLFLVTNKHVVQDANEGNFFFTLGNEGKPLIGQRFDVHMDNFEGQWHGHSNPDIDIAVMPLGGILQTIANMGKQLFFRAIDSSNIPNSEQINQLDAIEELQFIGYPNGIFDKANLMPIVRRGITATPLQIDYEGKPMFLIDASVFPGSSGSPVFIANTGGYSGRAGFVVGTRLFFLGVISRVAFREETGKIEFVTIPIAQIPIVRTQQMIDLGIVFKSSTVVEAIKDFLHKQNLI